MAISITKPTVGGSEDTWGTTINTALDTIVDGVNGTSGTIAPDLSTLTINGTDVTATAAELNKLDGVTATTTELNVVDGSTAATATTLADADRVVVNDDGTMKQVALTDFASYYTSLSNLTTVGALDSGSITSGFGAIDNGSSNITTTGTVTFGTLTDGTTSITSIKDEDDMTSNSASAVPTQQSVKAYVDDQVGNATQVPTSGITQAPVGSYVLAYSTGTGWSETNLTLFDTKDASVSGQTFTVMDMSSGNYTSKTIDYGTWMYMGRHYGADAHLLCRIS